MLRMHTNFLDTFYVKISTGFIEVQITQATFKFILEENFTVTYSFKCSSIVKKPKVNQTQHSSRSS
jgi:hypothetical protein